MPLAATRTLCTLLIGGCLQHVSGAILRRSGVASKSRFLQPQAAASVWPPETEAGATTSTTPQITSSVAPVASTAESQASSVSLSPSQSASNQESQSLPLGSSSSPPASPTRSNSSSSNSDSTSREPPSASGSSLPSAATSGGGGSAAAAARSASPTDPIIPTIQSIVPSRGDPPLPIPLPMVHGDPPPPTVPPCEKTAVAPIAGVPTFGDMFGKVNVTSACKCNCSQPMNETAVLHQLMNVAYHSADNAQAALEAVGKLDTSKNASQTAEHADQVATQALVIWNHLSDTYEKIEASTVTAEDRLHNLIGTASKAAFGYDQAIQQAREMSPQWPQGVR